MSRLSDRRSVITYCFSDVKTQATLRRRPVEYLQAVQCFFCGELANVQMEPTRAGP